MKIFVLRNASNADHIGRVIAVYAANDSPSPEIIEKLEASGYKLRAFTPGIPRDQEEWDAMLKGEILEDLGIDKTKEWEHILNG